MKEEHLVIKKLHTFAKNLLNFIERNCDISPLGDFHYETENASDTIISNTKRTLRNIRISNVYSLVFGYLNINSLRTKLSTN